MFDGTTLLQVSTLFFFCHFSNNCSNQSNFVKCNGTQCYFFFYGNTLSHHLLYSTIIRKLISNYTTFFPSLHTFKFSYYIHFKLEITSFLHQLILFFLSFLLLNFKSIFFLAHVFFLFAGKLQNTIHSKTKKRNNSIKKHK
jgi:hypothetical protein